MKPDTKHHPASHVATSQDQGRGTTPEAGAACDPSINSGQAVRRIVCLTMDYPPMRGGVARYLSELKKASSGEMEVWVPTEHPGQEEDAVKRVIFWWSGWPKWLPSIGRCLQVPKDKTILVSHVFPLGTAAWIASFFGGRDYAVLFHGTDLARARTVWKRFLLRRITSRAMGLFANSQATARALMNLAPDSDPVVVTPGVSGYAGPDRVTARGELGLGEKEFVVLSVCRLVERKGIDILIQAVAKLTAPNVRLAVVGSGPYSDQLHKLAALMGVEVIWVEDAKDDEVAKWYAAADVFCLPAREEADDVEGFGIVFLEAAAACLPVIAGKGWGTGEAVVNGKTGMLVIPDTDHVSSALQSLMTDPELRKKLGQAGKERAERDFQWEERWERISSTNRVHADVDVVIPCYNNARELEAALDSLVAQTLKPCAVVVVDNGSDDQPERVVNKYLTRLPIRCVRFDKERGAPVARNYGYGLTHSELVLFLDADTRLENRALEIMAQRLNDNPEISLAYGNFYWNKVLFKGRLWDMGALRRINWIHTSAMVRRSALEKLVSAVERGPFDPKLKKFQDWDLWLTLSGMGFKGLWINRVLFRITEQKNGMSRWLPSFVHKLPWPIFGWTPKEIVRYREAERIVKSKHGISQSANT